MMDRLMGAAKRLANQLVEGELEYRLARQEGGGRSYLAGFPSVWTGRVDRAFVFGSAAHVLDALVVFPELLGDNVEVIRTRRSER